MGTAKDYLQREVARRRVKVKTPAEDYHWPTVYAVVRASSERAVKAALARFGVKEN